MQRSPQQDWLRNRQQRYAERSRYRARRTRFSRFRRAMYQTKAFQNPNQNEFEGSTNVLRYPIIRSLGGTETKSDYQTDDGNLAVRQLFNQQGNIVQGIEQDQRIGNTIFVKSIHLRITLSYTTVADQPHNAVRLIFFSNKNSSNPIPDYDLTTQPANFAFDSILQKDHFNALNIIKDFTCEIVQQTNEVKVIDYVFKINRTWVYSNTTLAGTAQQLSQAPGNIFVAAIKQRGTPANVNYSRKYTINYSDK